MQRTQTSSVDVLRRQDGTLLFTGDIRDTDERQLAIAGNVPRVRIVGMDGLRKSNSTSWTPLVTGGSIVTAAGAVFSGAALVLL
jgi:hypothetical protein